ncbi:MAG: carbohydrate kinase family protein [Armatimonadota bacterium]
MQQAVIGFGELLWDMLPAGRQLGGAPANFSYQVMKQGLSALPVSCVGNDDLGRDALHLLRQAGLETSGIATCNQPTGIVTVTLDDRGVPEYDIRQGVAWDYINLTPAAMDAAKSAAALCFGTLAQRAEQSAATLQTLFELLPTGALRVFDVNLRQHYYSADILKQGCHHADILKLNDDELPIVCGLLGIAAPDDIRTPHDDRPHPDIDKIRDHFNIGTVLVTCGARGSLVASKQGWSWLASVPVDVVDTIGAGDAFTAGFVAGVLAGESDIDAQARATHAAARACSHAGAMG